MKMTDSCFETKNLYNSTWVLLSILTIIFSGCTSFNGRIEMSDETTKIFETYTILPDHSYYIHGSDTEPKGIIAINNIYKLKQTAMWRAVDATPEMLRKWLNYSNRVGYDKRRRGFNLSGPENEKIGIYYPTRSKRDRVTVNLEENGEVVVSGVIEDQNQRRSWTDDVFMVE